MPWPGPYCCSAPEIVRKLTVKTLHTAEALSQRGLQPGPEQQPVGPEGPRTSWLTDPDGYRIELVQWPPGHPDGISAADFA
jgi:lactoylglutathione lyase